MGRPGRKSLCMCMRENALAPADIIFVLTLPVVHAYTRFVHFEQSSVAVRNNGVWLVSKILSVVLESSSATQTTILTLRVSAVRSKDPNAN